MVLLSHPPLISTTTPSQVLLPNPPPHSSTYASRTRRRRFAVVCNAENHKDDNNNNNPNKTGGDEITSTKAKPIDRRNVLLGLGGLYGTTNLLSTNFSPSLATPISAPDLQKCSGGTDLNTGKPLSFDTCPPLFDYKLPPVTTKRFRPAAQSLDENYVIKYERAVKLMKDLDKNDPNDPRGFMQQAKVHGAYCNLAYNQTGDTSLKLQIHFCWLFFPWHRWYLYFYERILGKLIDDPNFGLPFWNWDNPPGMVVPECFRKHDSSLFCKRRNPDHMSANATVDLTYSGSPSTADSSTIIKNNLAVMYSDMVSNAGCPEDFYGVKYVTGSMDRFSGQGSVERGPHNAVHSWVGENSPEGYEMGNFSTAGRDPLFFSHHANVDRLWTIRRWLAAGEFGPTEFNDPELLDANFVFYDENAQLVRVKVRDAMDHKRMGYEYEKVRLPWLKTPTARVKKSNVAKSNNVPKATGSCVFPVTLNKVFKVLVNRPKRSRSKKEKEQQQELLVIEGIEVEAPTFVRFDVFVNDEDDKPDEFDKAEYAGCYSQLPHKNSTNKFKIRLTLTVLLEELDVDDDDQILVSLVPKAGGEYVTIGSVNIIYAAC